MSPKQVKKPWSGRFKKELDPAVQRYTRSLHVDRRLARYDIEGSRAHVRMLADQEIISRDDEVRLLEGLDQVESEIESGTFPFRDELEDIHMNVEYRLRELAGEAGSRVHTGRSRNDQVALDLKLLCLQVSSEWQGLILAVQETLLERAEELKEDLFAGWTHLQAAQPVSWGHYLLAYCEMLGRDFRRLDSYQSLHSSSPLGAGALTGSTLPLRPEQCARELGFSASFANSYDVAGDRDFVLELLQISTQLMLHLSRFAEDFVYFSSTAVSWVELPDQLCTGSSMMPQKKNPDVLELLRGKTASVLGHATALASLLKGLPSSYHRDLQQDKEHLFPVVDTVTESLEVVPLVVRGFTVRTEKTESALQDGFLMATDLAEYMLTKGVPFRTSHENVGKLVAYCMEEGLTLEQLPLEKIREFVPQCGPEVSQLLRPASAVERRRHKGSSGLVSVERQLADWKEWVERAR